MKTATTFRKSLEDCVWKHVKVMIMREQLHYTLKSLFVCFSNLSWHEFIFSLPIKWRKTQNYVYRDLEDI